MTRDPDAVPAGKIVTVLGVIFAGIAVFAIAAWQVIARPRIETPRAPNTLLEQDFDLVPADAAPPSDPRIDRAIDRVVANPSLIGELK